MQNTKITLAKYICQATALAMTSISDNYMTYISFLT